MKQLVLAGILLAFCVATGSAQVGVPEQAEPPSVSTGSVPLTYTGGDSRVSVGVDKDGHTDGELQQVFGNNGEHAVVAQLWWANGGAGGIQADYNWLFGTTLDEVRTNPDAATIAKLSFAIDQNAEKDRQANIGFAIERKEFFVNFFLSGKASGTRDAGSLINEQHTQQAGTDDIGNYTQAQTDIATTLLETQPYSYTVGVHGGHFSDSLAARFNGGFDYARGHDGAKQNRVSVSVDKYIGTGGWSVSGLAEHTSSDDPVRENRSDNRWWLFLRYEFGGGGAFRPFADSSAASAAWIERALRNPVTGHPRNVDTYVTRGKTTSKTVLGPKQYTARRPIAKDDTVSVAANSSGNAIDVLANDSDPDGNPLSITGVTAPANGTAQIAGDHVAYTPTAGFVGSDQFNYTISDNKGLSASAKVTISVLAAPPPGSGPPIARDDVATTAYGTPISVAVLANDSDPNSYPLTVASVTNPSHGTARINADGSISYTPNPGYNGPDHFSYSIDNGHGGSASANVTITVLPPSPPIARDDTASTPYETPVSVYVLENDTSPNGFLLTVTAAGTPDQGSTKIDAGGSITYTPQAGFFGNDTFAYSISDGHGGFASANVTVTVLQPGGVFALQADSAVTAYATAVAINVLANDQAPTGFTLTIKSVTTPAHGSVQIGTGGLVTYTPSANFNGGTDTFSYTASDGPDTSSTTVNVTVQPPAAPVAQNDSANTAFNTPVPIAVLANDSDPTGLTLTVTQVTPPAHGSAQINPNNTVTYTPQTNYTGADAFGYTISNGHGGSASANVSVTVGPAPAPVAHDDAATTPFNKAVAIDVLANDVDPNSLALSITQVGAATHGAVQINGSNTVTYTPQSTYSGSDAFSYTVSNGHGGTATANVSITVQQPLPPIAVDDTPPATPFGKAVKIIVLANDSDPNGLPLSVVSATAPQIFTANVTINADNTITYTPDPEFAGVDTFSYTIENTVHLQATATVTVNVQKPAPPVANDDSASTAANTPVDIDVLSNDTSVASLAFVGLTTPAHGMAVFGGGSGGYITYTPNNGFVGVDNFSYTVTDGYGQNATAQVTVTVGP